MSNATCNVSIIICAYTMDRWNDICEAIESAQTQEPPVLETILVADHNPELKARAASAFPTVKVIENSGPQGLSGARNAGIAASQGQYIAFLDDDAVADRHWIAHLVDHLRQPAVAGASAKVEPIWIGQRPAWFPDEFLWTVGCSWRGLPAQCSEIRNISGGACCLRRDIFEKAGGFNTQLGRTSDKIPLSCEETELCIRARHKIVGAKFIYEPTSVIHHKVPATRLTWKYFAMRCYAEGRSKAFLASLVGSSDGLSSERRYVFRTLSAGIVREIGAAMRHLDLAGLKRSTAIMLGLGSASIGYLFEKLSRAWRGPENRHLAGAFGRDPSGRLPGEA